MLLGNIVFIMTIVIYVDMLQNKCCFTEDIYRPRTNDESTFNNNHKTKIC